MKTSIIYLGVFALTIFTNCNAKNGFKSEFFSQNKQEVTNLFLVNGQNDNLVATTEDAKINLLKDTNTTEEIAASNVNTTYVRSIEEVIAEDNLITESTDDESQIAPFDKSVLKVIAEDNKIIESATSVEMTPLDFDFINKNALPNVKIELGIQNLDKTDIKY